MESSLLSKKLCRISAILAVCCGSLSVHAEYGGGDGTPESPYEIYTAEQFGDMSNDRDKHFILKVDLVYSEDAGMRMGQPFYGVLDGDGHVISNFVVNKPYNDTIGLFNSLRSGAQIKNLGIENAMVIGDIEVGGIVGENWGGLISRCYFIGTVSGTSSVGGIVGWNYGTLEQCYAVGQVTGTSEVGGLIGHNYNSGQLIQCYAISDVSGHHRIGGLVGFNSAIISECFGACSVNGAIGESDVGALVGFVSSGYYARNSFWDNSICQNNPGEAARGLPTSWMKEMKTYSLNDWDTEVWTIDEGNDYPHLAWENASGELIHMPQISMVGSGSESDPYQIETVDDFLLVGRGRYFWDKHLMLMNDLDLNDTYTLRIGLYEAYQFTGTFNGNNHVIANISISQDNQKFLGVFGCVGGGHISHLGLKNADIRGRRYAGALVGHLNGGTISQCYATGTVRAGIDTTDSSCGGLAGIISSCLITDCYSSVSVENAGTGRYTGGLTGYAYSATITRSYSVGSVLGGGYQDGGLVGYLNGQIFDSFWDTDRSGMDFSDGGVGLNTSQMMQMQTYGLNFWDNGAWSIDDGNDYPHLAWEESEGTPIILPTIPLAGNGTVADPYQIASVDDYALLTMGRYFWDKHLLMVQDLDLKGIRLRPIGYDYYQNFTGTFNGGGHLIRNAEISWPNTDYIGLITYLGEYALVENLGLQNVVILGDHCVGGLVGMCGDGATIRQCYVTGDVSGHEDVGGLVGTNNGEIENSYSNASVRGSRNVGGLAGTNGEEVTYCYASGPVAPNSVAGGLIGKNRGHVSSSFWDVENSNAESSEGGSPKTTMEMMSTETFEGAGWDFAPEQIDGTPQVWKIFRQGEDYPRLFWQPDLPGDIVGLYGVGFEDFQEVAAYWGVHDCSTGCGAADIDRSNSIGFGDISILAGNWLRGK
ncbi:MAG: hypothetical protein JXN61_01280 [Sedimentisphaerales bacterium]|nr:hypothetical protein [Sedimentisphaerales bacterium]